MTDTSQNSGALKPAQSLIPQKPSLEGLESKWDQAWEANKVYAFNHETSREQVFSIDTPPPTASGSLHIGHVFAYTQADIIARFMRMSGKNVFYPMGWDDNGLPTERRVQNYFGVRCDPSLNYVENFEPPHRGGNAQTSKPQNQLPISRRNFIELCLELASEDEKAFEETFRTLGISVDWGLTYQTISAHSQAVSQKAFLEHLKSGLAYQAEAPTPWDVTYRTAVAQAEQEDQERPGAYHRIGFTKTTSDEKVYIETTRPELLPACVALVAHPEDERYQNLFGQKVISPLFEVEVPVLAHPLAQPDKGAGIAMICTFGDATDVIWWRELDLPTRAVIGRDGRFISQTPWIESEAGANNYAELIGLTVFSAQQRVVQMLRESGDLVGEPRAITHPVKFYEKGDKPLEYVTSRQWYIQNGGRDTTDQGLRSQLLARGEELTWHPPFMASRYRNWVENLSGDWLVSRQRYFGVPIPLWYALDAEGKVDYNQVLTPSYANLPIDPSLDTPEGFSEADRDQPNGFTGDTDILDTWATSSLTPLLVTGWLDNPQLFSKVYPMDLRPQGHDIIRTWLFSTVVRSHLLTDTLPWRQASINGWILDPDRKKMSKSKGNVVTPIDLLTQYGSDGVRYWAARARQGADTAFEEGQMKIGRRLAIKILNASKFALGFGGAPVDPNSKLAADPAAVTQALDKAMLASLAQVITKATGAIEKLDYARALEIIEPFFWTFCDDYIELVKSRAHGSAGETQATSARSALTIALDVFLRLFAPYLPFATEEVWSWWRNGSVHEASWPKADSLMAASTGQSPQLLAIISNVIIQVRKAKSDAKVSQKTPVESLTLALPSDVVSQFNQGQADVLELGSIKELKIEELAASAQMEIKAIELGEAPAKQ